MARLFGGVRRTVLLQVRVEPRERLIGGLEVTLGDGEPAGEHFRLQLGARRLGQGCDPGAEIILPAGAERPFDQQLPDTADFGRRERGRQLIVDDDVVLRLHQDRAGVEEHFVGSGFGKDDGDENVVHVGRRELLSLPDIGQVSQSLFDGALNGVEAGRGAKGARHAADGERPGARQSFHIDGRAVSEPRGQR